MIIGMPKETKTGERRIALTPKHVGRLFRAGHRVCVEHNAGLGCRFSDEAYETMGAEIVADVYDSEMIVRVKEPPIDTIRENQTIMGYLHIEKGQNPLLLKALLDNNTTSYAYEEIRDKRGNRLVNLGFEAGLVGMYEGLRLLNRFPNLKPVREYFSAEEILNAVNEARLTDGFHIYILGKGRVSQGAQKLLEHTPICPRVLYRKQTSNITKYLPEADLIVNAVDWYPHEPRIITKNMLKRMKKTAAIIDISCDTNGAIESCIPTCWEYPTYTFNGITHFCIDNLPSAIPLDASERLGSMIIEHVLRVANSKELATGLMTRNGVFEYSHVEGLLAATS